LFSAFLDEVAAYLDIEFSIVNLASPEVFVGGLCGAGLVFIFSSLAIRAVGKTAQTVIHEVLRQFDEKPGILDRTQKPDYQRCVAIVARASLIQMVAPGLLAVLIPVAVGFSFRVIGQLMGRNTLGAEVSAGLLMVATITGIVMAMFFNNSGGAWDNAKKAIGKL
jgi:Na+/H+-translocating membrane pyrophosphatase